MENQARVITGLFDDARATSKPQTENGTLMAEGLSDAVRQMLVAAFDMHPSRVDEYWRANTAYQNDPENFQRPDPTEYSEPRRSDVGTARVSVLEISGAGGS